MNTVRGVYGSSMQISIAVGDEAHEERSLRVPGERDHLHTEHPILVPDQRLAAAFVKTLGAKLQKSSYADAFRNYGPGILVLTERDPLFTLSTIARIHEEAAAHDFSGDLGFFKHAYLGYRSPAGLLRFERVYSKIDEGKLHL